MKKVQLVPADLASQLVALLAASYVDQDMLEVGQGRGTKSLLLSHAFEVLDKENPHITAVELVKGKSHVSKRRLKTAGLSDQVTSLTFDATQFMSPEVPEELNQSLTWCLLYAPCSGLGHPFVAIQRLRGICHQKVCMTGESLPLYKPNSCRAVAAV